MLRAGAGTVEDLKVDDGAGADQASVDEQRERRPDGGLGQPGPDALVGQVLAIAMRWP